MLNPNLDEIQLTKEEYERYCHILARGLEAKTPESCQHPLYWHRWVSSSAVVFSSEHVH